MLPKYTVNEKTGKLVPINIYLQYKGTINPDNDAVENTEKPIIVFDFKIVDSLLKEEVSQVGVEEFFKDENFNELFSHLHDQLVDYDTYYAQLRSPFYFIVELTYSTYNSLEYGVDYDMDAEIVGYLNKDFNKRLFRK